MINERPRSQPRVSDAVVWGNALLDLKDNLCSFVGALCFEIITLGLRGFVYDDLQTISIQTTNLLDNIEHTLKFVGCLRVTLQPTTLLK